MGESNNFVLKRIGTYDLTGNRLGKGNFAYVELATNRITKSKVAMKVIDTRKIKDEYVKKNILREASLLKKVNHPNIVRLYETLKQNSIYCIVTEYVPGGELLSYLRSQNDCKLSESQARPIMRQLISALYHMHEQGIVHRDLKMENILLDENKTNIKIVDFGLSNICRGDDLLKTQCGSPEYAAPELFKRGCQYGTEVDLWSLGVIMYAIVVGRLPFRSPHFGSRGRNELIEQTSRGLSCMHNKYLVLLTHDCRDLLAKLLDPKPQMRLPLLDVMVHPWVTVQGTSPLVPFTEQPIDEKIRDKVLEKVSQLIKIHKTKIAPHVHQKRYDAITGVYNLLLDEELKCASKSNNERRIQRENTRTNSIIRVSVKSTLNGTANQKTGHQNRLPDSESSCEGQDSQPESEQDWEKTTTQKPMFSKPNEHLFGRPFEGLRIKGIKISVEERGLSNSHTHVTTRPKTATSTQTYIESPLKPMSGPRGAWNRANMTRCKSCIPRIDPKFDSKVHGRRVVMSPRKRQEPECLASQWESISNALVTEVGEEGSSHCEDLKSSPSSSGKNAPEKNSTDVQPEKSDAQLELGEKTEVMSQENFGRIGLKNCNLKDTPGLKQSPETSKSEGKQTAQILQTKSVTSKGVIWSHKGLPPSSVASQTISRAVSPLRTSQFVDFTDYHKHVPQPPKARIARQLGCGTRLGCKEGENEGQIDSFSAAYKSCLKNSKPQHHRLSIMQAQEILQHESKFHTKYGRKLNAAETSTINTVSNKFPDNQVSRLDNTSNSTPASVPLPKKSNKQQYNIPKPGYLKGVSLQGDQREIILAGVKREVIFEKEAAPNQNCLVGPNPSAERGYNEESTIKEESEKGNEIQVYSIDDLSRPTRPSPEVSHPTSETRLILKQEESLKRQKEKEQTENYEREEKKFLKELEDQERQKIITEYLQHVYSQYGQIQRPPLAVNKPQLNPRTYKVSKQGRAVTTRPAVKPGSDAPRVTTRPTPILHQAARGTQGDKKIAFKPQTGVKAANGVRFCNDWSNSVFTEYINSSDVDTTDGKEKDKLQVKDASFWLEQHLNGVLDETAATRKDLHNYQQLYIPRET